MINVRAPKEGYVSDEKANYRKKLYSNLPDYLIDVINNENDAYAVIMPSKEGLEIEVALNRGIKQEKIICVDENPALIAVSKWRKEYPNCKFYGCKVSDLPDKLKKNNQKVAFANLDLCNNFSEELISEVTDFLRCQKHDAFSLAITIAKGRENKATTSLLNLVNGNSCSLIQDKRARALVNIIKPDISLSNYLVLHCQGSYIHSKMPMTYVCVGKLVCEKKQECEDITNDAYNEFQQYLEFASKIEYKVLITKKIAKEHNERYEKMLNKFNLINDFHENYAKVLNKKILAWMVQPELIFGNCIRKGDEIDYYLHRKRNKLPPVIKEGQTYYI